MMMTLRTRNLSVDETGECYVTEKLQLPPEISHGCETLPSLYSVSLTCLLTDVILVDVYGSSIEKTRKLKFLLHLECYKDTQMKAYDNTKFTTAVKSNDNVRYRNKIY